MKNKQEKSDPSIVAKRPANKLTIAEVDLWASGAELAERREGAEGNTGEQHTCRTPSRESVSQGLERVRGAAKQRKKERFTALLHHLTIDLLRAAYSWLKREAAPGVDGRTWQSYKQDLEVNLAELHSRIHRGTYRALPSRRRYIPKPDGRQRPLGIAALEDKIVQRAVVEVLNAIYEEDFLGFSYGFRPGRGQHDALDALAVGITRTKVNWIMDADIAGFFDAVSHEWLMRFVEHRIGDRRINRLIGKWLKAGVMEEGDLVSTETGTPQGAVASPLLANIYLHYVFDLWADRWRKRHARGQVIIVRYADDIVIGFEHEGEARRFVADMRQRMEKFALSLHPEKTRLIELAVMRPNDECVEVLASRRHLTSLGLLTSVVDPDETSFSSSGRRAGIGCEPGCGLSRRNCNVECMNQSHNRVSGCDKSYADTLRITLFRLTANP